MSKTKKNIMREFRMTEISGVDAPAQEGARVAIMKRAEPTPEAVEDLQKRAGITSATRGHSHLVVVDYEEPYDAGQLRTHGNTSYADGHSHPWVLNDKGEIVIGEAQGHTHTVTEMGISRNDAWAHLNKALGAQTDGQKEKDIMTKTNDTSTKPVDHSADIAKMQAQMDRLAKVADLNDAEKGYFKSLDTEAADAFLAKSAEDRADEVAQAAELAKSADPVVYKSADGTEFRKSDDPRMVAMAKQMDADRKELAIAKAKAANATFEKTAREDFKFLPGDESVRIALAKAVGGIDDEKLRDGAMAALKAHNAKLAPAFKSLGAGNGGSGSEAETAAEAEAELDTLAKSIAAKDGIDYYAAYEKAGQQKPDLLAKAVGH